MVTIVDVRGDKVKLGIEAPQDVSVHRREVYEAIRRENQQAAQASPRRRPRLGPARPDRDTRDSAACDRQSTHSPAELADLPAAPTGGLPADRARRLCDCRRLR